MENHHIISPEKKTEYLLFKSLSSAVSFKSILAHIYLIFDLDCTFSNIKVLNI